jgi:outer membrane lipoprotein carrier protein
LRAASGSGTASGPLSAAQAPLSAAQLARAVDHHYNALHSLRVHFSESYAGMGMERTESGTLLLRKPGRMRWNYSKPEGKVFVLDGKWGWFYTPGDAQVQQIPAKELDDLRSPLRFLLGYTQLDKELSGLQAAQTGGEPGAGNAGTYTLSGVPRGMEQRVSAVRLEVTPDGTIHRMTLEELDGARTSFVFSGEEPDVPTGAADFSFVPPSGVPVVKGTPPV